MACNEQTPPPQNLQRQQSSTTEIPKLSFAASLVSYGAENVARVSLTSTLANNFNRGRPQLLRRHCALLESVDSPEALRTKRSPHVVHNPLLCSSALGLSKSCCLAFSGWAKHETHHDNENPDSTLVSTVNDTSVTTSHHPKCSRWNHDES